MREMKTSGIEWIGQIPNSWGICKIKHWASFINGYAFRSELLSTDKEIPVVRISDIQNGNIDYETCLTFEDDASLYPYCIKQNDIIIAMSGATTGKTALALSDKKAYINQRVGIIRNASKYIYYCLNTYGFMEYVNLISAGSAQPNISMGQILNFVIPYIHVKEQKAIADYLDKECVRIDSLVEKQRSIIEKLKEYKKSVITKAVTKGLNPTAPMKDSGIEWIGKIPAHWEAGKVFYYLDSMGSGTTPTGDDYYTEQGINWLNTGDLTDGYITEIPKKITPKAIQDFSALKIHKADSIVIAMYGATIGKLGIITEDTTTNQACCVMTPTKDLYNKFLFYCLYAGKDYMLYLSFGSGQPNINQNILRHFIIPHVPIEEQQAIADYLDQRCGAIDGIIEKREQMIKLLLEYKRAFIYEFVTGKKDFQ